MKIISCKNKIGTIIDYNIYESVQEVIDNDVDIKTLEKANPGDYVKSDNGFYLPLIKKVIISDKSKTQFVEFRFPRFVYKAKYYKSSQRYEHRPFCYYNDPQRQISLYVSKPQQFISKLLAMGMEFQHAVKYAYPITARSKSSLINKVRTLLSNKIFLQYLVKENTMPQLFKEFRDNGLDGKVIATELKRIIEDPKAEALKRWAIETSLVILNSENPIDTESEETSITLKQKRNLSIAQKLGKTNQNSHRTLTGSNATSLSND